MLVRTHAALAAALLGAGLLLVPGAAAGEPLAPGCAEFTSQRAAQLALRADRNDPGGLDPDRNRRACEGWDYTVSPPLAPVGADPATAALPAGSSPARSPAAAAGPLAAGSAAEVPGATPSTESPAGAQGTASASFGGTLAAADPTAESVLLEIEALSCTDYTAQVDAIVADSAAPTLDDTARGAVQDMLNARAADLDYCGTAGDVVVPTQDDGSTAVIGGDQVSVIPDGSAETGQG